MLMKDADRAKAAMSYLLALTILKIAIQAASFYSLLITA